MNTTTKRKGDWFQTHSGIEFYPLDARPEEILIEDIAHGLSRICRFGGHTRDFYSVAQHSVIVSNIVPEELALAGLLHDATEAYIGDMVRPLKYSVPQYLLIEDRLWDVIAARFNVPRILPAEIKHADNVALITERRDLLEKQRQWGEWSKAYSPLPSVIRPAGPHLAEVMFMCRFQQLMAIHN
jgi:uncharacterized protein